MSMSEIETVAPGQLSNARPIVAAVREFFASSQLSQFMDQINRAFRTRPQASIEFYGSWWTFS